MTRPRFYMKTKDLNWIEIDRKAILGNIKSLAGLIGPKVKIALAAKANGYGHGLPEIVDILNSNQVSHLALHSTAEADIARAAGWPGKIMLVGGIAPNDIDSVIRLDLEPTIFEVSTIEKLGRLCHKSGVNAGVHLKLETGTHRQGLTAEELDQAAKALSRYPEISVAGVSSHFANIEDTTDHSYARKQLREFKKLVARLRKLGIKPRLRHTACSAAVLLFRDTYFDLVRPGIAAFGYWPSRETYVSYKLQGGKNNLLKPALSFYSRITQIKTVKADSFIGYGCTYRTSNKSKIAVLPVGYSDGLDRRLSNLGYVLIKGRRAPIRGRICMNLTMVDITDIKGVRPGDAAVIIGRDGSEQITADTHADWCQTINYEILSRFSPLIPRYIV